MIQPIYLPPAFHQTWVVLSRRTTQESVAGIFTRLTNAFIVLGICLIGLAASFPVPVYEAYPIENTLRPALKRPLVLIGADGQTFARRGDCMAEPVTLDELPPHLVDAVLAMEDRRFYSHMGVDPIGIIRAAKRNYEAGRVREGGSTITQQLVKFSYLTKAKTLDRKMEEALLALWLELRLSKDQILERYLSSAYFGKGCYGVRAAARNFFDKPVGALSLSESALLVALLSSPTQLINNLDDATKRASLVIAAMIQDGRLKEAKIADIAPPDFQFSDAHEQGGYYADWLADVVNDQLDEPNARQPMPVYTTFDPALQKLAEEAVESVLEKRGGRSHAGQASLVAMRTDGRVVAMVGGRDWSTSRFNRAVQAKRQPGSSFKTFVYLAALQGGISPDMMIADEPISIDGWEPKNFGGNHRGTVSLSRAFASSINTVAVQLSEAVGRDAVITVAHDLGITSPLVPNPSLSLGTSEVSLLEMTTAYAAIAAGAFPIKPWGVAGLTAKPADGGKPPADAGLWRLEEADEMRHLLSAVVDGGSGHAAHLPIQAYGKTGTSQEHRDAWFIGFAGNLVVGVWVGNDDDSPMRGVTGGSLPAQIWKSFMREAMNTDQNFERKLPQIAAFKAQERAPQGWVTRLAELESLAVVVSPDPTEISRFNHVTASGQLERERERQVETRRKSSRSVSQDFQKKLNAMGWP